MIKKIIHKILCIIGIHIPIYKNIETHSIKKKNSISEYKWFRICNYCDKTL
jgi:hypothetical protein